MMIDKVVVVFGGTGFLGRHVVADLVRRGYGVRIVSRRPERGDELKVMGHVGQICSVYGDIIGSPGPLEKVIGDAHAVVNVAGAPVSSSRAKLISINAKGAENVAYAVLRSGVTRFLHISALGAGSSAGPPSAYLKGKHLGESAVRKVFPGAVVLRPGLVVGLESRVLRAISSVLRSFSVFPVPYCGVLQPVCAADFAKAVVSVIESNICGNTYDVVGSKAHSLSEVISLVAVSMGKDAKLIHLDRRVTSLLGHVCDTWLVRLLLGGFAGVYESVLTADQAATMARDLVLSGENIFEVLGVPTSSVAHFLRESDWVL